MDENGPVLVIGGANLDVIGQPSAAPLAATSAPGHIRLSHGGVARNVAENLARLEQETILITAVGDDEFGRSILSHAAVAGVDTSHALIEPDQRTGVYLALLNADGEVSTAVDDTGIFASLTPAFFNAQEHLFAQACMALVDANLAPDSLAAIQRLCQGNRLPLCGDPTSGSLAHKLKPHLPHLRMISPNVVECGALTGQTFDKSDPDAALEAARRLVQMGVGVAIITLGEQGVIYADAETRGQVPAIKTEVIDLTGHGDAMTAAVLFGLVNHLPLDECVRLGVTAASLTLRTRDTVRPDLSIDLLYNELVV